MKVVANSTFGAGYRGRRRGHGLLIVEFVSSENVLEAVVWLNWSSLYPPSRGVRTGGVCPGSEDLS